MTTTESSLSEAGSAPEPGRRRMPRAGAWLPTWPLITTKNLEIRKRRGLMITMVVLIIVPTVLFYGLRLLFHAVDPHSYALAGQPAVFLPGHQPDRRVRVHRRGGFGSGRRDD